MRSRLNFISHNILSFTLHTWWLIISCCHCLQPSVGISAVFHNWPVIWWLTGVALHLPITTQPSQIHQPHQTFDLRVICCHHHHCQDSMDGFISLLPLMAVISCNTHNLPWLSWLLLQHETSRCQTFRFVKQRCAYLKNKFRWGSVVVLHTDFS